MNRKYLPEYVHVFSVGKGCSVFFHALSMDVVYCRNDQFCIEGDNVLLCEDLDAALSGRGMVVDSPLEEKLAVTKNIEKYEQAKKCEQIRFLYIVPTVQCNLECTYCHIQHGKERRKSSVISEETLTRGLEIFKKYGGFGDEHAEIMFYGGEPFLYPEILFRSLDIIRNYSDTIKITIFTNGTLITNEIAKRLKKYELYVIVSMDGRAKSHDAARISMNGEASFADVGEGYRNLQKNGIGVGISLVAGTHNVDTLEDEVLYLASEFEPLDIGISTLHLFPDAENPNEVDIHTLTGKLQEVQDMMREKGLYIEHLFRKVRPFVEKQARMYDCPSCNSKLLITPWDTVGFCEAFMEEENYFYRTEGFELDECEGRDEWKQRMPLTNRECYKCPAVSICGGGCPYDAYCESGSICRKDERRCVQSREMISWLCGDLFKILDANGSINGQSVYEPSEADRKLLYGNVALDESIPLQNYSKLNEG